MALGKELFKKYPEVTKYTKQLFMHRLGSFFQFQVTPFLVYAFVSLQMAAYFGNYSTVVEKLHLLVNNLLGSTEASVGNLIAEGNAGKIRKVFSELFSLRMLIAGTVCFPLYQLLEPFITLWLGAGYILPREIMLLLVIRLFITITRGGCGSVFIRLRFVLGCMGSSCGKRDQHFRGDHRRLFMGIARRFAGGASPA